MSQPDEKTVITNGIVALILVSALFVWDLVTRFNGYNLNGNAILLLLKVTLMSAASIVIIIYSIARNIYGDRRQIIADIVLSIAFIICGGLNFGDLNWVRITALYLLYVVYVQSMIDDIEEKFKEKLMFAALLFIDYFVLGMLKNMNIGALGDGATRHYFPIYLIYFSLFYIRKTRNAFFTIFFTLIVAFSVFSFVGGKELFYPDIQKASVSDRTAFQNALIRFGEALASIPASIQKGWNETINPNYGYNGEQEQTENPQGVYLNEIEKGDMLFFEETPTLLWAVLEARTLEKPIDKVSVKCTTELEDGTIVMGIVNEGSTTYDFPVYSGVDRPLSCRFDDLLEGKYEAVFEAEFDFTTESRQLVYLMDRTRYTEEIIALRRQGLSASSDDVLRSVHITETSPESIYTSGPIAVKIGTNSFPWDIGDTNNILYRFGVEITNDWSKGGELKSLNKIRFIMPSTFSIIKNSCGVEMNYDSPKISGGEKIYETKDIITDVENERIVNCLVKVDKSSLDSGPEVTRRFLKAEVDYTYLMEQKTDFEIEKLHDDIDQGLIDSDQTCCLVSTSNYVKKPKSECTKIAPASKCYEYCCELKATGSSSKQFKWVDSSTMCDSYDSTYVEASILSDDSKCPNK